MRTSNPGMTSIPIPAPARSLGDMFRFSNDTRKAIAALSGRKPSARSSGWQKKIERPWQAAALDATTVKVAPGSIVFFDSQTTGEEFALPFVGQTVQYEGGEVTISKDSGTVYAVCEVSLPLSGITGATGSFAQFPIQILTVTVAFEPDQIGYFIYVPICTVEKSGDLVKITEQILDYNPVIQLRNTEFPWKATSNGNEFITIGPGHIISPTPQDVATELNSPFLGELTSFAGDDVEVDAAGTIYAVVAITQTQSGLSEPVSGGVANYLLQPASITVELNPTPTGDNFYWPICIISFTDGVATVDEQILNYNPIMEFTNTVVTVP